MIVINSYNPKKSWHNNTSEKIVIVRSYLQSFWLLWSLIIVLQFLQQIPRRVHPYAKTLVWLDFEVQIIRPSSKPNEMKERKPWKPHASYLLAFHGQTFLWSILEACVCRLPNHTWPKRPKIVHRMFFRKEFGIWCIVCQWWFTFIWLYTMVLIIFPIRSMMNDFLILWPSVPTSFLWLPELVCPRW